MRKSPRPFAIQGRDPAPAPGTLIVPERVDAAFAARLPRLGPGECWPLPWANREAPAYYRALPVHHRDYGAVQWRADGRTYGILAHRYSFQRAFGPIPEGKLILHRCNNKTCVNPGHLYAGDHLSNAADRWTDPYLAARMLRMGLRSKHAHKRARARARAAALGFMCEA